ncbi:MAG: hypothetical protein ACRBK7_25060 [Acidimicrobiales bacterium]
MAGRSALIVSHGQPSDPDVAEQEILAVAAAVASHLPPDWAVRGATLASDNAMENSIDESAADVSTAVSAAAPLLIYPMFMSDGWFTKTVIPKRLGQRSSISQLAPFGIDPRLPALAARWLESVIDEAGWADSRVKVLVAAHGSGKSARPAEIAEQFTAALEAEADRSGRRISTSCGYVEQEPFLTDAATQLGRTSICLPFFAARRGHVLNDLPEALDRADFIGLRLDPIGCHPDVPAFIADALLAADRP